MGRAGVREWALDAGSDRWLWGPGGWESPRWPWAGSAAGKALQIPWTPASAERQLGCGGPAGHACGPPSTCDPAPSPGPEDARLSTAALLSLSFLAYTLYPYTAGLHMHALPVCVWPSAWVSVSLLVRVRLLHVHVLTWPVPALTCW